MIKQEIRVLEGFEEIHAQLVTKREAIEEEVRKAMAERTQKIDELISKVTEVVDVEVPDEEPTTEENTEVEGY